MLNIGNPLHQSIAQDFEIEHSIGLFFDRHGVQIFNLQYFCMRITTQTGFPFYSIQDVQKTPINQLLKPSLYIINPPTTARVKISQNVDILPKVYLVHLKVKHCQTLRVVSTFTGQNESTVFDW